MKSFDYYLNVISNFIIAFFVLLGIYGISIGFPLFNLRIWWSYFLVFVPLICVAASLSLFFVKRGTKHNISMSIFFAYATLFFMNIYLESESESTRPGSEKHVSFESLAGAKDVKWDKRSQLEVVLDLRKTETRVFPVSFPQYLMGKHDLLLDNSKEKQKFFPLSGISKAKTVMCNENGKWVVFASDRFGFNNDDSEYEVNSGDRIVLLGDSLTQGFCVDAEDSIAGQLKAKGHNVINLASAGNGPLVNLAVLKEYAVHLKPKYIFWIYNDTDLTDLWIEYQTGFLEKYLEDDFSQNLMSRQTEIDSFWEKNIALKEKTHFKEKQQKFTQNEDSSYRLKTLFSLANIRRILGLSRKHSIDLEPVLLQVKKIIDEQDIKLYFVYAPINPVNNMERKEFSFREEFTEIAKNLNIPVIDFEKHIRDEGDYSGFFRHRRGIHYSEKGYSFLAKVVNDEVFN
jgi:hypothetical protein